MKTGTEVIWIGVGMPGVVVHTQKDGFQVAWEAGYPLDISGGTYWAYWSWIGKLIEVKTNGHKTPETLIDPTGRDLFQEAFEMVLEL